VYVEEFEEQELVWRYIQFTKVVYEVVHAYYFGQEKDALVDRRELVLKEESRAAVVEYDESLANIVALFVEQSCCDGM
jgi:hypothetical protein